MDKIEVNELLSKINYPGFSRDIVSFGMVSNIEIDSDNILINLKIILIKVSWDKLTLGKLEWGKKQIWSKLMIGWKNNL